MQENLIADGAPTRTHAPRELTAFPQTIYLMDEARFYVTLDTK